MRTLSDPGILAAKVGVASTGAVVLAHLLAIYDRLSEGVVALACVSASAYAGLRIGRDQLLGSAAGCLFGALPIAFDRALTGSAWALLPSLAVTVFACFRFALKQTYFVAGFTVLYLHVLPSDSPLSAVLVRMESVLVGIVVATLVNLAVSALDAPRITARRVQRVRERVRALLAEVREQLEGRQPASPSFEDTFATIAELRTDLAAATRELELPGVMRARRAATRGLGVAVALEEATHLAKELFLIGRESPLAEAGQVARALTAPWDGGELRAVSSELAAREEVVLASVLRRLAAALDRAAEPTQPA